MSSVASAKCAASKWRRGSAGINAKISGSSRSPPARSKRIVRASGVDTDFTCAKAWRCVGNPWSRNSSKVKRTSSAVIGAPSEKCAFGFR